VDSESGQVIHWLREHKKYVTSVAFSPDGRKLLTGSFDDTAILWDSESGQVIHWLREHKGSVNSVAFSPDGRKLLTGSADDTAILWDAETGQKIWQTPIPFWNAETWNIYDILVWFLLVCLLVFFPLTRVFDKGRFLYLRKPNKYVRLYDLPGIERWVC